MERLAKVKANTASRAKGEGVWRIKRKNRMWWGTLQVILSYSFGALGKKKRRKRKGPIFKAKNKGAVFWLAPRFYGQKWESLPFAHVDKFKKIFYTRHRLYINMYYIRSFGFLKEKTSFFPFRIRPDIGYIFKRESSGLIGEGHSKKHT